MDSTVLNLQTDEHVEGIKNIFKYVIIRQNQWTKKPHTHAETERTTDTRLFTKRISKNIIIIKLNWWLICYCCNPCVYQMYKWVLVVMLCVMECCNKKNMIIINIVVEMVGSSAGMARGHPEYHQIRMRISLVQREKNWIVCCMKCMLHTANIMRMATSVDPFVKHKPLNPFVRLSCNWTSIIPFFFSTLSEQAVIMSEINIKSN